MEAVVAAVAVAAELPVVPKAVANAAPAVVVAVAGGGARQRCGRARQPNVRRKRAAQLVVAKVLHMVGARREVVAAGARRAVATAGARSVAVISSGLTYWARRRWRAAAS
eukprot:249829-Chlamydomonas_euryale.AAC.2